MTYLYRRRNVWGASGIEKMARQSLGTQDRAEARHPLREHWAQRVKGVLPTTSIATWDTATSDLMISYRSFGTRNPIEAGYKLKMLGHYFTGIKFTKIDAPVILGYVAHRRAKGIAPGSFNVEPATLQRALRPAQEYGKLGKVPAIRMLHPVPPRNGFFERDQFEALAQALPPDPSLVTRMGYTQVTRAAMLYRYCIVNPSDLKVVARKLSDESRTDGHNFRPSSPREAPVSD